MYFLALDKPNGLHRRLLKGCYRNASPKEDVYYFLIAKLSVELLKKYLPICLSEEISIYFTNFSLKLLSTASLITKQLLVECTRK